MRNAIYSIIFTVFFLSIIACSKQEKEMEIPVKPICLASQSTCQITTSFGEFSVLFDRDLITTETEFTIFVGNNSLNKNVVVTGFMEGKNMYMGKIPLFFTQNKSQNNHTATTMLGSCTDKEMMWLLQLTVKSKSVNQIDKRIVADEEHFTVEFTSTRY